MLGQLLAARRRAFERHQQTRLHLRLGAGQFDRAQPVFELARLLAQGRHQFGRFFFAGAGINPEQPAVAIAVAKAMDRVDEPALFADFLKQPRRHAAAKRGRQHRARIKIGVVERQPREARAPGAIVRDRAPRAARRRRSAPARSSPGVPPASRRAVFSASPAMLVVVEVAGRSQHHPPRAVMVAQIGR